MLKKLTVTALGFLFVSSVGFSSGSTTGDQSKNMTECDGATLSANRKNSPKKSDVGSSSGETHKSNHNNEAVGANKR